MNEAWPEPVAFGADLPLPEFPVRILPDWAASFASSLATGTQTPVDLTGMLVLGALAAAAGGRVRVQVRPRWAEPLNLYISVAMPPGNRKSPVFQAVTAPLWAVDRELAAAAVVAITEGNARKAVAEAAAATAAREAAAAKGKEQEEKLAAALAAANAAAEVTVPVAPRLLADDATPEALASLMAAQGGRVAVLSDEGGVFDLMAGRYSNGPNLDLYLKGWSGTPHRVDRKGRPAEFIAHPALTMALAVQPDVLRSIASQPGFRGRGLIARFLYAVPQSPLGHRLIDPPAVPDDDQAAYADNLAALVRSLADGALSRSRSRSRPGPPLCCASSRRTSNLVSGPAATWPRSATGPPSSPATSCVLRPWSTSEATSVTRTVGKNRSRRPRWPGHSPSAIT